MTKLVGFEVFVSNRLQGVQRNMCVGAVADDEINSFLVGVFFINRGPDSCRVMFLYSARLIGRVGA